MIFAEQINKGGWDAETANPTRRGANARHFPEPRPRLHAGRFTRSRISAGAEQAQIHGRVRANLYRKEDDQQLPRKPRLPANLRRRPGKPNIYYQFDIDGRRFEGSTGTDDVEQAQLFLDKRIDAAYREQRLGIQEKRDILFSEAFSIATDVRKWRGDCLTNYEGQRDAILNAFGDFKLSKIDDRFSSTYERKRQKVAEAKGRKPYSLVTINHELALIQRVLHTLDEDLYILPKRRQRRFGGLPTYPVTPFEVDEAVAMPNNVLRDEAELFSLMDHIVDHAKPIVWVACLTGLRKSNVLDLNVENVDLERRIIEVVQKGGRYHSVHIHARLMPLLEHLIEGRERGPLFRFGQDHCQCRLCSKYRRPATSGKPHYVAGQDRKGATRRVRCIETGEVFANQTDAKMTLLLRDRISVGNPSNIGEVCRGTRKSAGNLTWEFVPAPIPVPVLNSAYRGGERIGSIAAAWGNARKAIGREDVRFHDLRHSIATWLTRSGVPLPVVQEHLGHRSILTTRRYAHVGPRSVASFLDEKIDGDYLNRPRNLDGVLAPDQERKVKNKAAQKRPNGSVPVLFDQSMRLSD